MNSGFIHGRDFHSGELIGIRWQNGHIESVSPSATVNPAVWLAPGLVDLQINGYGGVDFQQDNLSAEEVMETVQHLARAGCTRFLLTQITDDWPRLLARIRRLRGIRETNLLLRHAIAGWHVEGPFLSAEPGFCGAHDPALMFDPTPAHLDELREATEGDPLLLTIAPELPGALECITHAVNLGMKVSLGHTNASDEVIAEAVQRGATAFTHLGNGCPGELNRHDNILWRVFDTPNLVASMIPDGVHVSPALFRLAHRVMGNALYYTSDAMSAAAMLPGCYSLGRLQLDVGPDQIVRYPGKTHFAGSALRPIDGIFRAAHMLGCDWREVWPRFSHLPAQLMDLPCGFEAGMPADFCVLEFTGPNELKSLHTVGAGFELF